ncbi:hypothetical protein GCM10008994_06550 [Halorubrum ejinorense]|uniref:Uncharacterized protein n=1 Tax=Halorubrum ejinorense TaxID=425309 RepID=A0AAV3SPY2_9EURY
MRAAADPLDREFVVTHETAEVVLYLSGRDIEIAADLVEVDTGSVANVASNLGPGVRHL